MAYSSNVFGAWKSSFASKCPEHAGGCCDDADSCKELGDNDDRGLHPLSSSLSRGIEEHGY